MTSLVAIARLADTFPANTRNIHDFRQPTRSISLWCTLYGIRSRAEPGVIVIEPSDRLIRRLYWFCTAIVGIWLAWATTWVNIDFDDGYSTIANAQYFLGITSDYFWQRGPALALVLVPAEWLAGYLGLHPFDVRPHHASMALIHLVYLVGVGRLLFQHFGARPPSLLALLAALLTPVFFSYAPFISHDLFPGLLTLVMVRLARDFMDNGGRGNWWGLLLTGAALALIKQTYALVWVAVLVSQAILLPAAERSLRTVAARRLGSLALAALLSGAITWVAYALVLSDSLASTPFWWRPIEAARLISTHYDSDGGTAAVFYPWIYLRNFWAYGILAAALIVPGCFLSLRYGDRMQRSVGIVWILLLAAMVLTPFKEVRYLAFLAPLTAWLLVPAIRSLGHLGPVARWLPLLLLLDLANVLPEVMRLQNTYYRDAVIGFLDPLPPASGFTGRVIGERPLSFVSPEPDAWYGDRYHRITHINLEHIRLLYGYPADHWETVAYSSDLTQSDIRAGDYLLLSTDIAVRREPFRPGNTTGLGEAFLLAVARAEPLQLTLRGDNYLTLTEGQFLLLKARGSQAKPIVGSGAMAATAVNALLAQVPQPQP